MKWVFCPRGWRAYLPSGIREADLFLLVLGLIEMLLLGYLVFLLIALIVGAIT